MNKFDYGDVEVVDGRYYLHGLLGNFGSNEVYFIRWGKRRFMIPDYRLQHFINNVNTGCDQFQGKEEVMKSERLCRVRLARSLNVSVTNG